MMLALTAVLGQFGVMSARPAEAYNLESFRWQPLSQAISWDFFCNNPAGPPGGCAGWIGPTYQPAWQYWSNITQNAASRWSQAVTPKRVYFYQWHSGQGSYQADIYISWYTNSNDNSGWGGCYSIHNGYCDEGQGYARINQAPQYYTMGVSTVFNTYEVMHEFGHAMGLDHSCVAGSVMQGPKSGVCPNEPYACPVPGSGNDSPSCPAAPTADDVNGIGALYPSGTGGPQWYPQCQVGGVCQQSSTKPPLS